MNQITLPGIESFGEFNLDGYHGIAPLSRFAYPCTFPGCNFSTNFLSRLRTHTCMHESKIIERYKCPTCENIYAYPHTAKKHSIRVHGFDISFSRSKSDYFADGGVLVKIGRVIKG